MPATTIALHGLTLKYRYPQVFTKQSLEELERELAHVLSLVMRGLMVAHDGTPVLATEIPEEDASLTLR